MTMPVTVSLVLVIIVLLVDNISVEGAATRVVSNNQNDNSQQEHATYEKDGLLLMEDHSSRHTHHYVRRASHVVDVEIAEAMSIEEDEEVGLEKVKTAEDLEELLPPDSPDVVRGDQEHGNEQQDPDDQLASSLLSQQRKDRELQNNCVNDYNQLKNRVLGCNFGDTIRLCGNTLIGVFESNVLAINCDNIRLFCQGANGSCIIDKTNQNARILDVFGQNFIMQGVTLQNAGDYGSNGGCLYLQGDNASIQNSFFRNCVGRNGAAIYASINTQPTVSIRNSQFRGNIAQLDGAVAYLFQDNRFESTGNSGNNLVDANQAQGGCPGMYYFGAPYPNCIVLPPTGNGPGGLSGSCVSTEDQLVNMIATATTGTTIFLCATTIQINSEISFHQPQVSMACVAGDGQCILDGRGGNHRLINILPTAQGVSIRGVVLQNAGIPSGYGGCALNQAYGSTFERVQFRNCSARWGGGLFSFCTIPVAVNACNFMSCRASAMGGAGYYKLPQGNPLLPSTGSGNYAAQCRDVLEMPPNSCIGGCQTLASGVYIPGAVVSDRTCPYTTWAILKQGLDALNEGFLTGDTLTLCQQPIFVEEEIVITRNDVRIECPGAGSCVLDGANSRRIMSIEADNVILDGVALINGKTGTNVSTDESPASCAVSCIVLCCAVRCCVVPSVSLTVSWRFV
jgi:hypothetical protein